MITIRRALCPTGDELERMVAVIDEAFDFKCYDISLPPNRSRSLAIARSFLTAAVIEGSRAEIYVAEDTTSNDIIGVAVWFGPGSEFLSTPEQRAAGWDQMYASLDNTSQDWWNYFLPFYFQYTTDMFGEGAKSANYHLQVIGVVPSHWKRGVGRSLITVVEEKAKALGLCTCLETLGTSAVPFYARLGYEVTRYRLFHSAMDPANDNIPIYGFIKKWG